MRNWFQRTECTSRPRYPRHQERQAQLGNQNRCTIISRCKVGCMWLERHFRSGSHGTIWMRAVVASAMLFAVLAARNVPPHFPKAPGVRSAVSDNSHHDQRPRFDNSGSKWSAPADSFLPDPPAAESAHLAPTPQLFSTLQTKGFHYNRPPPVS